MFSGFFQRFGKENLSKDTQFYPTLDVVWLIRFKFIYT